MFRHVLAFVLVSAFVVCNGKLDDLLWSSHDGEIYFNGQPVQLKGLNWFGFQTPTRTFHGLWSSGPSFFLDFMTANDFNAIRIPLDLDLMLNDGEHKVITPDPGQGWPSPLMQNTSLEVLDYFVDQFAERGIVVLLDMHCLDTGGTDQSPIFFNSQFTIDDAVRGWVKTVDRYKDNWNVFGIDVFNEPFGGTWAEGKDTDMDAFVSRVSSAVHAVAPHLLIFVEGTAKSPDCTSIIDGDTVVCGYGDNLKGIRTHPPHVEMPAKVVYSPHTYGPSQHDRTEFRNARFPANMPDVWEDHWGYIRALQDSAVVLGEWGGPIEGENELWANALADYLIQHKMQSNFIWCLNSDSSTTGLLVNWTTADEAKLQLLQRLTPNPTNFTRLAELSLY